MDNSTFYLIGLFVLIAFLIMLSYGSNRRRNSHRYQQGQRRNYGQNRSTNYGSNNDAYNNGRRENIYYEGHDDEFGGVGMFIGIAFLLLIGYGVYRYNEGKFDATTKIAEVPYEDSLQEQYYQESDQDDDYEEDSEIDYSVDNYPNNNGIVSTYDHDVGGVPEYYPQEYKDAAEQVPLEPTTASVDIGNFYAQTGAYGQLENANAEQKKWVAKGFLTKIVVFKNGDGLFRVLVGGYLSEAEAKGFMGKKYEQVYDLGGGGYYEVW